MIGVFERGGSPCVRVRVQSRSRQKGIVGTWNEALKVCLTAPPVEDRANRQLIQLLADCLAVSKASIKILSGRKTRLKTVQIQGLSCAELKNRITLHLV